MTLNLEIDPMLTFFALSIALWAAFTSPPAAEASERVGAFEIHHVQDELDREIRYFLSDATGDEPQPIVLYINGSGASSAFFRTPNGVAAGGQNLMLRALDGKARVLVVDKPGTELFGEVDQPGTAVGASETFLQEHTLDRWTEANRAALDQVIDRDDIDATRVMVLGHSEGSDVAALVAAVEPRVTHVALLAGGGPTQLFDFVTFAARSQPGDKVGDAAARVEAVYDDWAKVLQKPNSIDDFWRGHPYRRWSSFMATSPLEEVQKSDAKIFAAHGTHDQSTPIESFDLLVAGLRARGRAVESHRVEGASHAFAQPGETGPDGMVQMMRTAGEWFLAGEAGVGG